MLGLNRSRATLDINRRIVRIRRLYFLVEILLPTGFATFAVASVSWQTR